MTSSLVLISLNVRGIRERGKRANIFEWCKKKGGDIILLQETYSTEDVENQWKNEWEGSMIFSHGTNHSRGVLVLFSPELKYKLSNLVIDGDGRFILFRLETKEAKLVLGNLYFPTRDKQKLQVNFLEGIESYISNMWTPDYSLILGGDFNIVMDGKLDYKGSNIVLKTKFNESFEDFLNKYRLIDIWRKRNPCKKEFTFKQKQPLVQSRLDYWFISTSLEKLVDKCEILTSLTPDHSGIKLKFRNLKDTYNFGKSYWKFNSSLCLDKIFVDKMNVEIRNLKETVGEFSNRLLFWDYMKMKMRQFAMKYFPGNKLT